MFDSMQGLSVRSVFSPMLKEILTFLTALLSLLGVDTDSIAKFLTGKVMTAVSLCNCP